MNRVRFRKVPEEILNDLNEHKEHMTNRELAEMISIKYDLEVNNEWVKCTMNNHGIRRNSRLIEKVYSDKFPEEVCRYIVEHYKGVGPKEMALTLNEMFNTGYTRQQLKSYYANHKLDSGLDGRFTADDPRTRMNMWRKGKHYGKATEFKKGERPLNAVEVGTVTKTSDGYLRIKVSEPDRWKFLHRKVWEENNGPIPKGHMIIFLDGNRSNCSPDNLKLISKAEHHYLNIKKLRSSNAEVTDVGIMMARLKIKTNEARRKKNELDK